MINLFRAEWKKVVGNYKLAGFLVWIYPVGFLGFYVVMLIGGVFSRAWAEGMVATGSGWWTEDALGVWGLITSFPFNTLGRMLPLAFMSTVFAYEYQWGTWKNLIPRNRRAYLILAKMAVLITLIALALVTTSLVTVAGQGLGRRLVGWEYGPAVTGSEIVSFLSHYLQAAFLGILVLIILAGIAALAAILTRSVLGGLLAGFGFSLLDSLSMYILLLAGKIFSLPGLINVYRFTPAYSVDNSQSWFRTGAPILPPVENFPTAPSLSISVLILIVWCVGLIGLAIWAFHRQDITS
jgi:ABC-type transport system involved in multi-copper enzyme maturation permease subunit